MKAKTFGGAAAAIATIALALAGAPPAEARHKAHRAPKAEAEKHKCGGKNGCPARGETDEKAAPGAGKAGDARPADGK
jgi:uncharacterized membrane protein